MIPLLLMLGCHAAPLSTEADLAHEVERAAPISPAVLQCAALHGGARGLCTALPVTQPGPAMELEAGWQGAGRRGLRFADVGAYDSALCNVVDDLRQRVRAEATRYEPQHAVDLSTNPPVSSLLCLALADGPAMPEQVLRKRKVELSIDADLVWQVANQGCPWGQDGPHTCEAPSTSAAQAALSGLLPLVWRERRITTGPGRARGGWRRHRPTTASQPCPRASTTRCCASGWGWPMTCS